jgi:hypothetical protein
MKTRSLSLALYKNKFKMDQVVNVKPETLKLLEENMKKFLKIQA